MAKKLQSEQLPGLESPAPDMGARNAFGRVPKPEYFGINPDTFADVTAIELDAISPDRCITPYLYGGSGDRAVDRLALNAVEYEAIVRSQAAFVVAIEATTEKARQLDLVPERKDAAITRSVAHAKESKVNRATKVIEGLESEQYALKCFKKEIASPGYAHVSEAQMRILAETARTSFDNILEVVGHQKNWSNEQKVRANLAMNARLFDPSYKKAFSFWKQMTDVSVQYTHNKIVLFNHKRRRLNDA